MSGYALPSPGGAGGGTASPGATQPSAPAPRRSFQRTGSYHKPGLSEADALTRLRERRAGERSAPSPRAPAPARTPVPDAAPPDASSAYGDAASLSPLQALIGEAPRPIVVPPSLPPLAGGEPHPFAQQPPLGPQDPVFDLTVAGAPTQVSLSELVRGYMRERDYTAKTQSLGAQMRQTQEQFDAFKKARETLEARLPAILAQYAGEFDQPIDWLRLAQTDPIGYSQKDARYKAWQAAQQEARTLAQLRENETRLQKEQMRTWGHGVLCDVIPGWRDPVTRKDLQTAQIQYLRAVGFSQPEIDATELLDPRHVLILEEARRFRLIAAQHPELLRVEVRPEPPVRRGGAPPTLPGNGQFARISEPERSIGDAQQRWDQLDNRTGAGARDAAIALIHARRVAREVMSGAPPPSRRRPS